MSFSRRPRSKVRLVRLYFYRMVKRVRRIAGGASQVERICANEHTPSMTARFWEEWRTSKRLQGVFKKHAHSDQLDPSRVGDEICTLKRVSRETEAMKNVVRCLEQIAGVNQVAAHLRRLASTPFSTDNEEHEQQLEELWKLLLPGVEREGRVTRQWGRLGFQQSDPATDFRGGGLLALHQLLHFARTRPSVARRMIVEPADEAARYPWACVGINITNEALKLMDARLLDRAMYGQPLPRAVETFHSVYGDMFEVLHSMWLDAKPENILAFPPVMKATMERVRDEIQQTGTLVPPGAEDSTRE